MPAIASPGIGPSLFATGVGIAGVCLGLWLTGAGRRAHLVVPFSAGVLLGVVFFGLVPELIEEGGWSRTLLLFTVGYGLLLVINRKIAPVCPSCSHDHNHQACDTALHGFATPLLIASALHSFFDGWNITTAELAVPVGIRIAVPLAIALHKLPEGMALGAIVRASVKSRRVAMAWSIFAEATTLLGGLAGLAIAPELGTRWILYPLGLAAGWLFYLGAHAVHEEWKRRGAMPAFVPALTGAAGAAALQQGVQAWLR